MTDRPSPSVVLPAGHTGSSLFHTLLEQAAERFPHVLGGAHLPKRAADFKRDFGRSLARFEALRAGSEERVAIARFLAERMQRALSFGGAEGGVPLTEYLTHAAPPPALHETRLTARGGLPVEVPLDGRMQRGDAVHDLIERLFASHQLTAAAQRALHWIVDHAAEQGGAIDLRGQRFVLLGAGAELASTRLLLRAGADVLWVDLAEPLRALGNVNELGGTLSVAPQACNLLEAPREIAAAIRRFAADDAVHLGLFAYAPGASKEWRLGAAMNAIVSSLEPELVRSVSLLISPTTPSVLSPESVAASDARYRELPRYQRALERVGALRRPAYDTVGDVHVGRSTVSLQGLSYQAAQYLCKIATAESYAVFGTALRDAAPRPTTVSANVAGVTRTRSLSHPLFESAFRGADKFGVRIFEPATTRALSGLLMLHDLLNPSAPGSAHTATPRAKAEALLSQQIHGGIYTLPFELEGVIRAAAVIGLASRPSLLLANTRAAKPARLASAPAE